ncbi:hypothetical protein BCR44DRAFT_1418302 [Catenaria anguillulae PL171]|uniref:ABC transporter domain-containing protein n=1 Tax=Catenaria anguillulae PL171 TaxID=765915 RepID=A0A1Y2H6J3_9FUNG|nr:hypothetical protein BCR44DRAFT_1418302 [Catenaria anguillulae PL171]
MHSATTSLAAAASGSGSAAHPPTLASASRWAQFRAMFRLRVRMFQSDPISALPLLGFPVLFCSVLLWLASNDDSVYSAKKVNNPSPYHHFVTFAPSYVAGGSADPWAVKQVLTGANATIMDLRAQRFTRLMQFQPKLMPYFMKPNWHKANSMPDLQALSREYATFYREKREEVRRENIPPFGGFMLHSAPTPTSPSAPLNWSIVLNPNPNLLEWSLNIPQLMMNAVLNGMQFTLPPGPIDTANVPPVATIAQAGVLQDPGFNVRPPPPMPEDKDAGPGFVAAALQGASGPPGPSNGKEAVIPTGPGDFGPVPLTDDELKRLDELVKSFNASSYARTARQLVERHQRDPQGAELVAPPWSIQVNGTLIPYRVHPSEAVNFLSVFAPPLLVMAIFFLLMAATRNMTVERVEGQFAYFVTNGLSPSIFYLSTIAVYLAMICIGLAMIAFFFLGAKYMSVGYTVILLFGFTVVVLLQSATLSFAFDDKQLVPSVLFLLIIAGSVGPQIMTHLLKIPSLPQTTTTILYILLPSFALNKCFLEMVLANTDMTSYRPFAPNSGSVYSLTLCILASHALVFFASTLLLAQSASRDPLGGSVGGSWVPSWLSLGGTRGESKNGHDEDDEDDEEAMKATGVPRDPHLTAEKERIRSGAHADDDVVRIEGLSMTFPGTARTGPHKVLDDLWFSVKKNECFAFLGPNGAGKSTTINILTGQLKATQGTATVCGKQPNDPGVKRLFGLCPQYDHVYKELTVRDHLVAFAAIKGVPAQEVDAAVDQAIADAMLEDFRYRKVKELSGGTRRRLTIAIACLGRPAVVILDEPTTGVDIATRRTIWSMVQRLNKHMSVLLVTHDMDEAERLSQRAGIMINGSLVCLGSASRLKSLFGSAYMLKMQFAYATPTQVIDQSLADIQAKVAAQAGHVLVPRLRVVHRGESSIEVAMDMIENTKGAAGGEIDDEQRVVAQMAFLGEMLGFVTDMRARWAVTDYSLAELTLTELFVRLAQHHRTYQDEEAAKHS